MGKGRSKVAFATSHVTFTKYDNPLLQGVTISLMTSTDSISNQHLYQNTFNLYHSRGYFSRRETILFLFSPRTGFDILCKLSPMVTICMKCQNLFSGDNMKTISFCLLSAKRLSVTVTP